MADRESGGATPWLAFLAGIVFVAVVAFGIMTYTGGMQDRTADLEIDVPNVEVNPPDIDLPEPPPAPTMPPSAEGANP